MLYGFYLVLPFSIKTGDSSIVQSLTPILMLTGGFSIIFTAYCSAKTIKTLQHKENTRTADIIVEMFLILYFGFGILWVQKRVSKLLIDLNETNEKI